MDHGLPPTSSAGYRRPAWAGSGRPAWAALVGRPAWARSGRAAWAALVGRPACVAPADRVPLRPARLGPLRPTGLGGLPGLAQALFPDDPGARPGPFPDDCGARSGPFPDDRGSSPPYGPAGRIAGLPTPAVRPGPLVAPADAGAGPTHAETPGDEMSPGVSAFAVCAVPSGSGRWSFPRRNSRGRMRRRPASAAFTGGHRDRNALSDRWRVHRSLTLKRDVRASAAGGRSARTGSGGAVAASTARPGVFQGCVTSAGCSCSQESSIP